MMDKQLPWGTIFVSPCPWWSPTGVGEGWLGLFYRQHWWIGTADLSSALLKPNCFRRISGNKRSSVCHVCVKASGPGFPAELSFNPRGARSSTNVSFFCCRPIFSCILFSRSVEGVVKTTCLFGDRSTRPMTNLKTEIKPNKMTCGRG